MKTQLRKFLEEILSKDLISAKKTFKKIMESKTRQAVDDHKKEVSAKMFQNNSQN